ncbi:LAFE_0D01838g1_1 [Lachancea fermentati]|uniref:Phosphatidylethanolamine N-methyltransferase n=1 Tax=Lachancea fermentati TaxID=4955 RepID=A0A1G4MAN0_LACFM|nr:LAFE_0D01838g1_1 [Lachancea fermentati]
MIKDTKRSKSVNSKINRKPSKKIMESATSTSEKSGTVARTRTGNVTFIPPRTHDMVRSLFDPTLKKSFLECCISLAIISNFVICYFMSSKFGTQVTKVFFLWQYLFWRLCYNLGIGIVLNSQSKSESLTNFAKSRKLFSPKSKGWLAKFCRFELQSKMPSSYKIESYPEEFNVWMLFRQFVDLILMQDFTTYILYVYLCLPSNLFSSFSFRVFLGFAMIVFNVWVKVDAHRVVKDYAWYWGDFFFFQDSKLVFDGVFNISPHPMYSIGYMGYYGLSLISGDYKVLLVSLWGHLLQFLFLKYCENPHIERIYSNADENDISNSQIDDLLIKQNHNYSRPLVSKGLWFANFDKLRVSDYVTVFTALAIAKIALSSTVSAKDLFWATFIAKLSTSGIIGFILHKQSTQKWFTKLFLENGYTQLYSYQQWQFIYNYCLTISYSLLVFQTIAQFKQIALPDYTQIIFGFILCFLQVWCDDEIMTAISEFGWFYGDFFLTNYIDTRKLTSQGIYRYLNNPERFLGVAGSWGGVLITNFSLPNIILAVLWTLSNIILVKFVEEPHVNKVYGALNRKSGVSKTLLGFKPLRRFSEIMDRAEAKVVEKLLSNESPLDENSHEDSSQWDDIVQLALQNVTANLAPNCEFVVGDGPCETFQIPGPIKVTWKLPSKLYHKEDWIGLYRVLETGDDRHKTRISSNGHWCPTQKGAYSNIDQSSRKIIFQEKEGIVSGQLEFDYSLLYFEEGVYEMRYHSKNSHKVLMISQPFRLSFPIINTESSESFASDISSFLERSHALKDGSFVPGMNKCCTVKCLRKLIKQSTGVHISAEFLKKINYDIQVSSARIFDIKKVLESLE